LVNKDGKIAVKYGKMLVQWSVKELFETAKILHPRSRTKQFVRICQKQGRIEHRALASGGRSPETGRGIT